MASKNHFSFLFEGNMPTIFYDWKSSKTGEYFHNKLANNERTIVFPNKYLTDIFSCILQKNIVAFYVQFLILQKTTCGCKLYSHLTSFIPFY